MPILGVFEADMAPRPNMSAKNTGAKIPLKTMILGALRIGLGAQHSGNFFLQSDEK